jgi:hypothetical protein
VFLPKTRKSGRFLKQPCCITRRLGMQNGKLPVPHRRNSHRIADSRLYNNRWKRGGVSLNLGHNRDGFCGYFKAEVFSPSGEGHTKAILEILSAAPISRRCRMASCPDLQKTRCEWAFPLQGWQHEPGLHRGKPVGFGGSNYRL